MGSSASKATRKLPKENPSWAASRTPAAGAGPTSRPRPERPLAFENKNQAIEADAKDPHFMAKLSQLGPVRVDHHMQTVRTVNEVQKMYRSRMQSETEASSMHPMRNHLLASSLTELLEARKSIMNTAELDMLAQRYEFDVVKLQQIVRVVNTPSVDESTVVRTTDKHGEESVTMMARWVDPALHLRT